MAAADAEQAGGNKDALKRAVSWLLDRLDTLAALLGGVVVVILGANGAVKGDALTTATLGVLTVVAFSLVRERTSRLGLTRAISYVGDDVRRTQDAVASIAGGAPYRLLLHEAIWDIRSDGGATATRTKRVRFAQNEVVSMTDWWHGDGHLIGSKYSPGTPVHAYRHNGRRYELIALDRVYARDEELDFQVERDLGKVFPSNPDRAAVVALDQTKVLRIKILWPSDRPPTAVRLRHLGAAQDLKSSKNVMEHVKTESGRPVYCVEEEEPELGGCTMIEWDW